MQIEIKDKKLIGIHLALFMIFGFLLFSINPVYAESIDQVETKSITEFAKELTELYDKYDIQQDDTDNEFESARLLVWSSVPIEDQHALEIIYGYANLYVLQYESVKSAKEAYYKFSNMDAVSSIKPDHLLELDRIEERVQQTNEIARNQVNTFEVNAVTSYLKPVEFEYEKKHTWVSISQSPKSYLSWGTKRIGLDTFHLFLMRQYHYLPEVQVAVLDTGIDISSDLFYGRILQGGKNYVGGMASTQYNDDHGHGTMVSSVIVDNSTENVKILPIKVLNSQGKGYDSQVVLGMAYAIEYGVDFINMSMGAEGVTEIYQEMVDYAEDQGIIVVAAAGNDGKDVNKFSPANIGSSIAVSSTNKQNECSRFSNYGEQIDFAAPGEAIGVIGLNGVKKEVNGTSFAAPYVTASIALLKSVDNRQEKQEMYAIIQNYATDLGIKGWDGKFGHGLINLKGLENVYKNTAYITYNLEPGTYEESVLLNFQSNHKDIKLYYTTDGTEPDNYSSKLYTNSLFIDTSTNIKVVGYMDDVLVTDIFEAFYRIRRTTIDGFKVGDVDRDGRVSSVDAFYILQFIVGKKMADELQWELADIDQDGKVTSLDVWQVLKMEVAQMNKEEIQKGS